MRSWQSWFAPVSYGLSLELIMKSRQIHRTPFFFPQLNQPLALTIFVLGSSAFHQADHPHFAELGNGEVNNRVGGGVVIV
jgi:hypothetical protein